MKSVLFFLCFSICSASTLIGQSEEQVKVDNLKYYLSVVKEYTQSMRYYTDSVKIIKLLDEMDNLTVQIEDEINAIVIPEEVVETMSDPVEEITAAEPIETENNTTTYSTNTGNVLEGNMEQPEGVGLTKFLPFKPKFKTSFRIQFGINSLHASKELGTGVLQPEINTAGSWYWDFSLVRKARLGGANSKVNFIYGLSYLKHGFSFENDVKLIANDNKTPGFARVQDNKNNPKLTLGYLNIPLAFNFALSQKTKFEVGGYFGYRIRTKQSIQLKANNEVIHENRFARYALNNWAYGLHSSIDISGFDLIVRYNMSNLFRDNPTYDYNIWMIGTSISLF